MRRSVLAKKLMITAALGLLPGCFAVASIPSAEVNSRVEAPSDTRISSSVSPLGPEKTKKSSGITSYYGRLKSAIIARFRPVKRESSIDFNEAKKFLDTKTTNEKIFDEQFTRKLRGEYAARVSPHENTALNPYWRARTWELQRYDESRKDLARWTTREVLEDQLKEFFQRSNRDSAPMKVLSAARELSGGEPEGSPAKEKASPEQKIARAHRTDLPKNQVAEEEKIPTKLKTKVNVLRGHGSVVFSNPIATTSVIGSKDEVSVVMDRDFKKLSLKTSANYGIKDERLDLNLNKQLTDQVSVDLGHTAYTGGKRFSSGEKMREQARVNYSISF